MHAYLCLLGPKKCPSMYRLNTKQLEDETLIGKLSELWADIQKDVIQDLQPATECFLKGFTLARGLP